MKSTFKHSMLSLATVCLFFGGIGTLVYNPPNVNDYFLIQSLKNNYTPFYSKELKGIKYAQYDKGSFILSLDKRKFHISCLLKNNLKFSSPYQYENHPIVYYNGLWYINKESKELTTPDRLRKLLEPCISSINSFSQRIYKNLQSWKNIK